jgi:ribosomal protein S6
LASLHPVPSRLHTHRIWEARHLNREYELFYVLRPDIDEDQVRTAMDDMAGMIGGQGGEMTKSSLWGRRRLAYTIAGFN